MAEASQPLKVLVTGADGFIGRQVVAALRAAGHAVLRGVRPASSSRGEREDTIGCDFGRDLAIETWLPRLAGVDAVINCAGILRATRHGSFEAVHVAVPLALFGACERAGLRRVIQVSALGDPADGEFIASKHRADAQLATLDLDWIVLRPSLVYSPRGSYGGSSLLRAMAATPAVLLLPGSGRQALDPLDADDLAALVVRLLKPGAPRRQTIEVVGPETLSLEDYLRAWRAWLRIPPPRLVLRVPKRLVALVAATGEWLGSGPLGRTMHAMLARGNVGGPDSRRATAAALGRLPRPLRESLAAQPSFVQDRWQARLHLLAPLLRIALALMWILSAWVGYRTPPEQVTQLLGEAGIDLRGAAQPLVVAASTVDLVLGLLFLVNWRPALTGTLMCLSVLAYTVFFGIWLPASWWDPLGGLLKNLALLPALLVAMVLAQRR